MHMLNRLLSLNWGRWTRRLKAEDKLTRKKTNKILEHLFTLIHMTVEKIKWNHSCGVSEEIIKYQTCVIENEDEMLIILLHFHCPFSTRCPYPGNQFPASTGSAQQSGRWCSWFGEADPNKHPLMNSFLLFCRINSPWKLMQAHLCFFFLTRVK